jgi:hypothetical protein
VRDPVPQCLECKARLAASRGLCQRCYSLAYQRVRSGKTTWPELEASGLALPLSSHGELRRRGKKKRN